MSEKGSQTARGVVDSVHGKSATAEIWTSNYDKVLPLTVSEFDLTAVLPAVFYMFRYGFRRGKGRFIEAFGGDSGSAKEKKNAATIDRIAGILAATEEFSGFQGETERAILGDLLLSFCLENAKKSLGREEPVLRSTPAHFMSSWLDLPASVAHLRFVPEMLVALLADQRGPYVEQNREGDEAPFAVGRGFEGNVLLQPFHQGVSCQGELGSRTADVFDETAEVGIDQLLMIRLAQQIGQAPEKLRGKESGGDRISNQRPIAERASFGFSKDLRRFILGYSGSIPRHSFVEMLESCMAIGLTTILTSTCELMFSWAESGRLRALAEQRPAMLLVDCSNGVDKRLRGLAEQSLDDFLRRVDRLPVILMALRLLDQAVRNDPALKKLKAETLPYATEWIDLLGSVLHSHREESRDVLRDFARLANRLSEELREEFAEASEILEGEATEENPVWRVAEAISHLQGKKNTQANLTQLFDSVWMAGRPHGLAAKRSVIRAIAGASKKRDVRSLVFTDSVMDHLVHLHVLPDEGVRNSGKSRPLSYSQFLGVLRERYGFCVDASPPGLPISNELLQENRRVLERRLRDLGLLTGVNDAESMKRLRPRFEPAMADNQGDSL